MNRRAFFAALTGVAMFAVAAGASAQTADDFPNRPIRIIVPQAAGSGVDLQARVLAQKMGELWGQQGVVDNRAGANAIIGMEAGANAKPDGYTLIYAPVSAVTTNAFIYKKLPYDTFRDFIPITGPPPTRWVPWSIPPPASSRSRSWWRGPKRTPAASTTARSASAT
jgi:tripartite-type tricarboxylate transporter receptor subunit TctC